MSNQPKLSPPKPGAERSHQFLSRSLALALLLVLIVTSACGPAAAPAWPDVPPLETWPTAGWQTSTPEQQGLDSQKLIEMFEFIQSEQLNLHSLLVIRNGYLVLEAYAAPYGPEDVHTVESNTKSVVAALTGIAIDQGKIASSDQKLLDFFPHNFVQNLDARKQEITLHDLLAMQPGLDCEDFSAAAQGMYNKLDWVQYLLDLPITANPGEQWIYCSGAAHLLSAVLEEATGMDARSYANQNLFAPLGIEAVGPGDWGSDPKNVTNGIAGLFLTPRDLAKLGLLYLQDGRWEGQQVIPQAWMETATSEQAYIGPDEYVGGLDRRFGYMFSIFPEQKMYGYLGRAGQELYVVPEKNLVVVFTAGLEVGMEASLLPLVTDYIVPAARSTEALPANADAERQLEAYIQQAAGETLPVQEIARSVLNASGATYIFEENPFGWQDMTFSFQPGSAEARLQMSNLPDLSIGLDGRYRLTDIPNQRPIGLRGRWQPDGSLVVDYITVGEFSHNVVVFRFISDRLDITVHNLNFPGEPVGLVGLRQP